MTQATHQRDLARGQADLLQRLAQCRRRRAVIVRLDAPAGQADLARMIPQMGGPLGEDQMRLVRPGDDPQQHGRLGAQRAAALVSLVATQPAVRAQLAAGGLQPSPQPLAIPSLLACRHRRPHVHPFTEPRGKTGRRSIPRAYRRHPAPAPQVLPYEKTERVIRASSLSRTVT